MNKLVVLHSLIYPVSRARSILSKDEKEVEVLKERWQTGHDICSIAGCNIALEDCKEGSGYDYGMSSIQKSDSRCLAYAALQKLLGKSFQCARGLSTLLKNC